MQVWVALKQRAKCRIAC